MRAKNAVEEGILEFVMHNHRKLYSQYFEINFPFAFKEFNSRTYDELVGGVIKKPVIFPSVKLKEQQFVIKMIGAKTEKRFFNAISIMFPLLSIIGLIISAIIFRNYLLLLGILIVPITNLTHDYLRPLLSLILFACLILAINLIGTGLTERLLFLGFAALSLLSFELRRMICVNLILEKARKSELVFRFLYTFNFIYLMILEKNGDLITAKFGNSTFLKRPQLIKNQLMTKSNHSNEISDLLEFLDKVGNDILNSMKPGNYFWNTTAWETIKREISDMVVSRDSEISTLIKAGGSSAKQIALKAIVLISKKHLLTSNHFIYRGVLNDTGIAFFDILKCALQNLEQLNLQSAEDSKSFISEIEEEMRFIG